MFKKKSTKDLVRPDCAVQEIEGVPDESGNEPENEPEFSVEFKPAEKLTEKPKKGQKPKKAHGEEQKADKHPFKDCFRNKGFIGGLCITAALIIAFVAVPMMQKLMTTNTASVVVLKQDVAAGTTVTKDMVTTKDMLTYSLPDSAVGSVNDAVGKYVKVSACKGDVLTKSRLSETYPGDNPELADLPKGKMAISLSLDTLPQSVSGKLRAGDVIQLYAAFKDSASKGTSKNYNAAIIPELQYVEVLSVSDEDAKDVSDHSSDKDTKKISTVTVAVNASQAKAAAGLESSATLYAALVSRGDTDKKNTLLSLQETYFNPPDSSSNSTESEAK